MGAGAAGSRFRIPDTRGRRGRGSGGAGGGARAGGLAPCREQTLRPRAPLGHLPGHLPALGSGCARAGSGVSDVC